MSEFSECLSYFIKEGKTDTALLEERTGVPCSVIASFLKGKELPEQSVFRILLRELPLTVEEERILSQLLLCQQCGRMDLSETFLYAAAALSAGSDDPSGHGSA